MTRPEDIPERVWEEARHFCDPRWFTREPIARAILAAEKREREACAQIAREHDMASGESIAHMIMTRNEWQPAAVRKVLESSDA